MATRTTLLMLTALAFSAPVAAQPFVDATETWGLELSRGNGGGLLVADLTGDGWVDVVASSDDLQPTGRTRFFEATVDDDGAFLAFVDTTAVRAPGLAAARANGSLGAADLNQDGCPDIVRAGDRAVEVFLCRSDAGARTWGSETGSPDWIARHPNRAGAVGADEEIVPLFEPRAAYLVDIDADGWVDILAEQTARGALAWRNDEGAGWVSMDVGMEADTSEGGGFGFVADLDADGLVDAYLRRDEGVNWWRNAMPAFVGEAALDFTAPQGDRGSALACDFDGDGRLDVFHADGGGVSEAAPSNRIALQLEDGVFSFTDFPYGDAQPEGLRIDGAACGDLDADGDVDLFLAREGRDRIWWNTSDGDGFAMEEASVIFPAEDSSTVELADLDGDGDLDALVLGDGFRRVWRNDIAPTERRPTLTVRARQGVSEGCRTNRNAIGATVQLFGVDGAPLSGLREISGGHSYGSQRADHVLFAWPEGHATVFVATRFIGSEQPAGWVDVSAVGDVVVDVCDVDADFDGVPNNDEVALGTDPFVADTDGDGLLDAEETGINPVGEPTGTDATDADTDDDGLLDGEEWFGEGPLSSWAPTDPTSADTDGDGLPDGYEVGVTEPVLSGWSASLGGVEIAGTEGDFQPDPTPESQTDPNRADTDGGGSSDGAEEAAGTDPLDPDDDPPGDGSGEGSGSEGSGEGSGSEGSGEGSGSEGSGEGSGSEGSGEGSGSEGSGEGSGSEGSGEAPGEPGPGDLNDPLSGLDPNGGLGPGFGDALPAWPPADEGSGSEGSGEGSGAEPGPGEGTGDPEPPPPEIRAEGGALLGCSAAGPGAAPVWLAFALIVLATRRRRVPVAMWLTLALAAPAMPHATASAQAGFDAQNLQLSANRRSDYIVGQSGQTQAPRTATFSAVFHHVDDPVVLRIDGAREAALVHQVITSELTMGVGVVDRFDFGFALPVVLFQSSENVDEIGRTELAETSPGVGDLRLSPRVGLLLRSREPRTGGAAASFTLHTWVPTGGAWRSEPARVQPTLAFDVRARQGTRWGVTLGYQVRGAQEIDGLKIDDMVRWSSALDIAMSRERVHWILESTGAWSTNAPIADDRSHAIEALSAVRWFPNAHVGVEVGFGTGLTRGVATPDWRGLIGVTVGTSPSLEGATFAACTDPSVCDRDDDGFVDADDLCPDEPEDRDGLADHDGCPEEDFDGDRMVDVKDLCPAHAEDRDAFADHDGCPDLDDDLDGIADADDACRLEAEDRDGFEDHDGCPDFDDDGDTIADAQDACPRHPEDFDGFEDADGCPEPGTPLVEVTCDHLVIREEVYFANASDVILPESYAVLNQVAQVIRDTPTIRRVRVEGHTDSAGDASYNLDLSRRRALSVYAYLAAQQVGGERLEYEGYGEAMPIADNETAEGRSTNRRVAFRILSRDDACEDGVASSQLSSR